MYVTALEFTGTCKLARHLWTLRRQDQFQMKLLSGFLELSTLNVSPRDLHLNGDSERLRRAIHGINRCPVETS